MSEPVPRVQAPRVLLLEDAPSLGRLFADALVEADLEVEWVSDLEAAIESAAAHPPALIAVDDLLDGVRAADRLDELLEAAGEGVRLLAMSARAEEAAPLYAQLGASECLAKPLPPRALAARCRFLLSDGAPDVRAETDPFVVISAREADEPPPGTPHPMLAVIGGALRRALELRLGDEEAAADMARVLLEDEEVAGTLPAADVVLDADLSGVSMVQVIQMLALEQQSGLLRAEKPGVAAEITFADGTLDLAVCPPGPDTDLLAEALATGGVMELDLARRRVAGLDKRLPLVQQVVDKGWIKPGELRRAVADSTRKALFEVLSWREGRMTFRARPPKSCLATDIGLGLSVDRVLMVGARRIDEWHVLEKRLPDPGAVFVLADGRLTEELRETLTAQERAILDLLDGRTTLDELLDKAEIPSYSVQSLLHRLITLRLIRRRAAPALVEGG